MKKIPPSDEKRVIRDAEIEFRSKVKYCGREDCAQSDGVGSPYENQGPPIPVDNDTERRQIASL
ncbi:hypothetical protein PM082_002419 [Marasmius tenuissimus]|nr:hypothetical protein PM082_002419 [Marasmius tenuissimus]